MRLDLHVSKILNISRNKSSELIKKGEVFVNTKCIKKPSFFVEENDEININSKPLHVSRAGEKLAKFLDEYPLLIENRTCLDIGSSTGGFVEVLLRYYPKNITAVDVGTNQLHVSLRDEEKIILHEQTDIRDFTCNAQFDIITCDVSFISFKDIAKYIDNFAKEDIIILFKPQFEVGKNIKRDRKGVVKDRQAIENAMSEFEYLAQKIGWNMLTKIDSRLSGKEGNLERFYAFKKR